VAFIKAYGSLARFRGEASFGTWLFRIGINHCKDVLKMRSRNRARSLVALLEGTEVSGAGRMPASLVQEAKADDPSGPSVHLQEAMGHLSKGEREVLLRVADKPGEDYGSIGLEMGLTREGVKGRLKRARAKVIRFMKKRGS